MADPIAAITLALMDGTKIVVPDALNLLTPYILQEQGDWFEEEINFLRQVVQPGQTVMDIGANYGVYALSLARRVGPQGTVWAFEPAADTARYLAQSIAANATPWLRLEQVALSDHVGTAWLHKPGQSELNSLHAVGAQGEGEPVELTTLDACMERWEGLTPDLLKIDAEGEEKRILTGGRRMLETTSPLVMFELKEGSQLHLDLLQAFEEMGYACYRLVPGLGVLEPFAANERVDAYLLNLFAAKPDRAAALAAAGFLVEEREGGPLTSSALAPSGQVVQAPLPELEAFPYGRSLAPQWREAPGVSGGADNRAALASWFAAQEGSKPVARRLGALRRSYALLRALVQGEGPAVRLASLARVAWALGERETAVWALDQLQGRLDQEGGAPGNEPFLAPHPAYDAREPGDDPALWLEAATLEALECWSSYSSFFQGAAALPRLERLQALGLGSPSMERRLALVRRCFGAPPPQAPQGDDSVRPWFNFLELEQPLRCLDGGAMDLRGQPEPWVRWAQEGCAVVIGFEPQQQECDRLNQTVAHLQGAVRYLPVALGDGQEHILHITNIPMTSSLFAPARATVDLFPGLGEWMQVERQERVRTQQLDGLAEARQADFLKLDVQGAELMVLKGARATLADVAVVQCEVAFLELYEGQPLMADVDAFLRSEGFCFLKFATLMGRPFKPLRLEASPLKAISQTLWADGVYVRDFRQRAHWSSRQLKVAAFLLHELYKAPDLVCLLLGELDARQGSDWQGMYGASVLMSDPAFGVD